MVIRADKIDISFIKADESVDNVLNQASFVIDTNLTLIRGVSGSGKSTILNLINTDILPSSGTLEIDGVKTTESIFDFDSHAKKVLYIKQDFF